MLNIGARYPIGINIGMHHIYAAQIKVTRKGVTVTGLDHRELIAGTGADPDENPELISACSEMSKNRRFRGKSVALHLPDKNISVFPIRFKVGRGETMAQVILRECRKHLSFPVEEAVIDYPSVSPAPVSGADTYKATIIAARREVIQGYIDLMKQAGLTVEAVDFPVSSLLRLHTHIHDAVRGPIILCNIGREQSLFSAVSQDSILALRNIPWGVQPLLSEISANLEHMTGKDNIAFLLKSYGLGYENRYSDEHKDDRSRDASRSETSRAIYQTITPYIDELVYEFHKMIGHGKAEEQYTEFEGIHMYGFASWIHWVGPYFEKRLGIPTRVLNPFKHLDITDKLLLPQLSDGAPFALALGLSLRKIL
jgi:type IV pilus assembly protein PilM